MSAAPDPSWCFFVEDACGERFLFTVADRDYEAAFRKHARWWVRHRTRPGAHRDKNAIGQYLSGPVKPVQIVAMPSEEFSKLP